MKTLEDKAEQYLSAKKKVEEARKFLDSENFNLDIVREELIELMSKESRKNVESGSKKVSVRTAKVVVIIDENEALQALRKKKLLNLTKVKIDLVGLKKYVSTGIPIEGTEIVDRQTLSVTDRK